MKKATLLFVFTLFCAWTAGAQDRIIRTDDTSVEARVIEITPGEIRYKRFSNPDGPTYILPVEQVRCIVYPNGERDVFNDPDRAAGAVSELSAASVPSPSSFSSSTLSAPSRAYAVGDYYEQGAVRGVVCDVSDEGMHGLVLSLDETVLPWTTLPKSRFASVGCTSNYDGQVNMQALERYIGDNGLAWSDFPAFEWCRAQGEGWYLPSIDELLRLCANYNGGTRIVLNREARTRFNDRMREYGGKRMDRLAYYFSSTEQDVKEALCAHTDLDPPFVDDIPKGTRFLVRAVHRF